MVSRILLILFLLLAVIDPGFGADPEISKMDRAILQNKLNRFAKEKETPIGDLVLKIGMDFLNTPYVAKTLDMSLEEKLVVNLHQLDCTTFAENSLALARTVKSGDPTVARFCAELEGIRYRNGRLDGYASRLHYFSEWIRDNEARGRVTSMASKMGGVELPLSLDFMSTHPREYPQLVNDPATTALVKAMEEKISAEKFWYIPAGQYKPVESQVKDGDIVTLTTSIPGIDVTHVGILFWKEGAVHMLHASSTAQKVVISTETFAQYLSKSKKTTGIMIARPLE